jgi:hypothetical protein
MDEKVIKMVDDHWEYVKSILEMELPIDMQIINREDYLDRIGHHYKTAMIHGYKHGKEDK